MAQTDFFVAVSGDAERAARFGAECRFRSDDEQGLIKEVIGQSAESILLLAFVEDSAVGKALCKAMFSFFAESINPNPDVYTQFKVSFVEEKASDLIQYRCERLGDIDAVVEAENGAHDCSSICATNVVPQAASFMFLEQRLTVVVCSGPSYTAESLERLVDNAAAMVGCRVVSVGFYVPKAAMCNSIDLDALAVEARAFRESIARRPVGIDERVSSRVRLQDVRAWSLMVCETNHFSPIQPGPYFLSLNPQPVVGEKLAHYIHEERTYIVGEGTNASPLDFCVMPPLADGDALHRSIYSPHCRVRREGLEVWLKPECGMTYVNGKLLAEETRLVPNDRVILGKQLAFRYAEVGTELPRTTASRILDWELCAKEFRQENGRVVEKGTAAALERDNVDLRARCNELETRLQHTRGDSWLMLTNPPSAYRGALLWPLDLRKRHSQVTIGPQGDVAVPFLTGTATIKHAMDGLVFKCAGASIPITNGSRFTVGVATFAISLDAAVAPGRSPKEEKPDISVASEVMLAMQSSFFSLQWSIGALFDFVLPFKGRKVRREDDAYFGYRNSLYDSSVMEANTFQPNDIAALNTQLTAAVRLMGAALAKELRECNPPLPANAQPSSSNPSSQSPPRSDALPSAKAEEFLKCAHDSTTLSAAVLKRLHDEIGMALLEGATGRASNGAAAAKMPRSATKERPRDGVVPSASVAAKLQQLKGTCFVASTAVVRRASTTVDLLNISMNAKAMWERHVQHVSTVGKSFSEKKGEDAILLGELLLFIVDVVLSTDYCLRRQLLAASEVEKLEQQLEQWQRWADRCVSAVDGTGKSLRGTWKHEAAVQRSPTPHIRRSTGGSRGESRPLDRTTKPSGLSSRRQSFSRTSPNSTSAPPRINGNLGGSSGTLSTTFAGKTPQTLSSFRAPRKSSVASVTSATGTRPVRRNSSSPSVDVSGVKKRSSSLGSRGAVALNVSGRRKPESSARSKKK